MNKNGSGTLRKFVLQFNPTTIDDKAIDNLHIYIKEEIRWIFNNVDKFLDVDNARLKWDRKRKTYHPGYFKFCAWMQNLEPHEVETHQSFLRPQFVRKRFIHKPKAHITSGSLAFLTAHIDVVITRIIKNAISTFRGAFTSDIPIFWTTMWREFRVLPNETLYKKTIKRILKHSGNVPKTTNGAVSYIDRHFNEILHKIGIFCGTYLFFTKRQTLRDKHIKLAIAYLKYGTTHLDVS